MFRVLTCLTGEHDLRLVLLAGNVCFLASMVAISLFRRAEATVSFARAGWLAFAGAAAGCGIWATHFIAMLAYEPGVAVAYDIILTTVSLILAAVITSAGLTIAASKFHDWSPALGGAVMGCGVASMHYTGMWALQLQGRVTWAFEIVIVSIILGVLFGAAAMTAAVRHHSKLGHLVAAVLLTLAIVSHHFTAMGAVEILPDPTRFIHPFSFSPGSLALVVAGAAILILGLSFAGAFADRRIQERDVQLLMAVNNMSHGIVMFDKNERLVVCNDRYIEMYGLSRDNTKPGTTLRELVVHRNHRNPDEFRTELLSLIAKGEVTSWVVESADGRAIAVTNRPMLGGAWVASHEDVSERRRAEARIEYLAHHDALTELPNRAAFNARLAEQLSLCEESNDTFALICIDLDRFKEINDVFGHTTGDGLLQEVSRRLERAAGDAFVARLGGDEFALITKEGCQPSNAATLGERLLASVAEDLTIAGKQLRIGLSIGIAMFPDDGMDSSSLAANADAALYRAKAHGRATIRFFEADMDKRLRERRAMQHDLRSAIERRELKLHYQPQARINGGVVAFEALLRWQHPQRGSILPIDFIPLAEDSGLILSIGEWVLREACREAASWSKPIRIGVNLSPVQFSHDDLPGLVHSILLETGLPAPRLELEITEGVLIEDVSRTLSILRRIKSLGVRIAMDDFGTGYSSLSYLQAFPFDKIKIDHAFISNLKQNSQSATIVRAVIGLARGLNVPVIAEGVETKEQLDILTAEGCDEVQGYLVGRPAPIENYADLVNHTSINDKIANGAQGKVAAQCFQPGISTRGIVNS